MFRNPTIRDIFSARSFSIILFFCKIWKDSLYVIGSFKPFSAMIELDASMQAWTAL